jgi:hypothetical protein
MCFFFNDCPFEGLGILPILLELTPRCQIDFPLHHAAVGFDTLLHHAAVRFDSLMHYAMVRFDYLLQNEAVSHISPLQNAVGKFNSALIMQPDDYCNNHSAASCSGKNSETIIHLTLLCIMHRRDLTPCCKMQLRDLTPCCMMLRRDLTPRCIMQRGVKLQFYNTSRI